jgi:integrase
MTTTDLARARSALAARSTRVQDVLDAWEIDARCRLERNPHTISHCRAALRELAASAGVDDVAELTVDAVLAWMTCQPSSKTRANKRTCVNSIFDYLIMRELIAENPARRIKWTRPASSRPIGRPLSRDQVATLVATARNAPSSDKRRTGDRRARIYLFLWGTALRRSEAMRQLWADVDLDLGCMRITKGKVDRGEIIPLPPWLVEEMRTWPREGPRIFEGFVAHKSVLADFTRAGIGGTGQLHRFRSGAATFLRQCGLDLPEIARLTRHADLNTLRKSYIEPFDAELASAQRLMAI